MQSVVITDGFRSATFHSAHRSGGTDPYVGDSFKITISDDGLTAERSVFVFSHDWAALAAFFHDLAESWRGWTGTKSWVSIERDLTIEAQSDAGRHCLLSFIVRDGPVHTWTARTDDISFDAGEDLITLAASSAHGPGAISQYEKNHLCSRIMLTDTEGASGEYPQEVDPVACP